MTHYEITPGNDEMMYNAPNNYIINLVKKGKVLSLLGELDALVNDLEVVDLEVIE